VTDDLAVFHRHPVASPLAPDRELELVRQALLRQHLVGVQFEGEPDDPADVVSL
jgi:hypothetical protein